MSQPSTDARAVVRALDALTTGLVDALADLATQVKRAADYRQSDFALTPDAADDAPTTGDDGPRCVCGDPIELSSDPAYWIHSPGSNTPCTDARPAIRAVAHHIPAEAYRAWTEQAPAADEDALRTARRDSARIILDRASRGIALRSDEAALLRQHFEAETREHDTARSVARSNLRHVKTIVPELEQAETRAKQAEDLLRIAHETSNRSEAARAEEERLRLALAAERDRWKERYEEAQAAIERVHEVTVRRLAEDECSEPERRGYHSALEDVRRALDGTEQPTTEA